MQDRPPLAPSDTTATQPALMPRGFAVRVAVFYGALFVIYGTHVPFTPLWLADRGLTAAEISIIMSAPLFLRVLVTPALALAADRHQSHRAMMIALAWAGVAAVLALTQAATFWPLLLLVTLLVICNSSLMPLAETVAVRGVREAGLDYGRVRLWGSLTFIAASFCGGLILDALGAGAGIWLVAIGCALTVAGAHLLPRLPPADDAQRAVRVPIWHAREPRQLLASKPFLAFLVAAGGAQAAHATMLSYGTLIWQQQGLSTGVGGALWAVAVLAEVALFAFSGTLLARIGAANMLIAAAAVSVLRWVLMAFDPPLAVLVPLQVLHALTYGGSHIGAIYFIAQAVPPGIQGSAQALYATIASGIAMGAATLLSGALLAGQGSSAAYLAMGAVSAAALGGALLLKRQWPGGVLALEGIPHAAASRDAPAQVTATTPPAGPA
jgi:PPP family 3-phenylpropionic acid transporter